MGLPGWPGPSQASSWPPEPQGGSSRSTAYVPGYPAAPPLLPPPAPQPQLGSVTLMQQHGGADAAAPGGTPRYPLLPHAAAAAAGATTAGAAYPPPDWQGPPVCGKPVAVPGYAPNGAGYPSVSVHCEAGGPSRTISSDPSHGTGAAAPPPAPPAAPAAHYPSPLAAAAAAGELEAARAAAAAAAADHARRLEQHRVMTMASWLVPSAQDRHPALFTAAIVLGMSFTFAFMAGDYATWLRTPGAAAAGAPPAPAPNAAPWGPGSFAQWLTFWRLTPATSFSPVYVYAWGARYMPAIAAGEWWRLFASFCLHGSFVHLAANMALFALLAAPLEHTYGFARTLVIFLASAFGANFLSMTFEEPCVVYVGASGAVYGFIGLAIADLLLNWDTVRAPAFRMLVMLAALGLSLAVEYLTPYGKAMGRISHLSHVGGLLGGLFVSFMFLPNLKSRRWKAMRAFAASHLGGRLPAAAPAEHRSCWARHKWLHVAALVLCALAVLFLFAALPAWVWLFKLPRLACPATPGLV